MPRGPRLDAPGALHHVMVRGLDRQVIFRDDHDRDDFLRRLEGLVRAAAWTIYAWALLPNHAHLLVRTGSRPLPRSMRSLLTGYAGAFNRRHKRTGHLFQNRYKSIMVEADPYLLEVVRYLHLNPVRAKMVADLGSLDRYPWTGHSALLGRVPRPWQETAVILARFGKTTRAACRQYRAFVAAGVTQGRRPEFQGGGLVRSAGGWAAVQALRRGREAYLGDERILGSSDFVEGLLHEAEQQEGRRAARRRRAPELATLVDRVARATGMPGDALTGGGRGRALTRVRDGLAYLWVEVLGRSGQALAQALRLAPASVYRAARRGRVHREEWDRMLTEQTR